MVCCVNTDRQYPDHDETGKNHDTELPVTQTIHNSHRFNVGIEYEHGVPKHAILPLIMITNDSLDYYIKKDIIGQLVAEGYNPEECYIDLYVYRDHWNTDLYRTDFSLTQKPLNSISSESLNSFIFGYYNLNNSIVFVRGVPHDSLCVFSGKESLKVKTKLLEETRPIEFSLRKILIEKEDIRKQINEDISSFEKTMEKIETYNYLVTITWNPYISYGFTPKIEAVPLTDKYLPYLFFSGQLLGFFKVSNYKFIVSGSNNIPLFKTKQNKTISLPIVFDEEHTMDTPPVGLDECYWFYSINQSDGNITTVIEE